MSNKKFHNRSTGSPKKESYKRKAAIGKTKIRERSALKNQSRDFRKKLLAYHEKIIPKNQVINQSTWESVRKHWNYKCAYCKEKESTTIDHVVPIVNGGMNSIENVLPACLDCNVNGKKTSSIEEYLGLTPIYQMHADGFVFIAQLVPIQPEQIKTPFKQKIKSNYIEEKNFNK